MNNLVYYLEGMNTSRNFQQAGVQYSMGERPLAEAQRRGVTHVGVRMRPRTCPTGRPATALIVNALVM